MAAILVFVAVLGVISGVESEPAIKASVSLLVQHVCVITQVHDAVKKRRKKKTKIISCFFIFKIVNCYSMIKQRMFEGTGSERHQFVRGGLQGSFLRASLLECAETGLLPAVSLGSHDKL